MTVYVDQAEFMKPGGRKRYCHMFASTTDELHAFADKIGRKRCWFHKTKNFLHYDLCEKFRELAIQAGALEINTRDVIMAKNMNKTIEEYLENEGWSSHHFARHAKYCFENLKDLEFKVGRTVIHATNTSGKTIKAYVHHNGRTNEYVTFTDTTGHELDTVHHRLSPPQFADVLLGLFK